MALERVYKRCSHLVFVDEAGFMLGPLVRRTWAPRGCTPVIRVSEPHGRISVAGAITISPERAHFGFYFQLSEDNSNFNGNAMAQFVEDIYRKLHGPITLLWDEIAIHWSQPVMEYLAKRREIVVEPFPAYAPELNPVDGVWSYVKWHRLANYTPSHCDALRERITAEFHRLQKRPDLLRSFLRQTGLSL